jgi:hypothetical protein
MHLLPRGGYEVVSELFEYVRNHGAYRFSVTAKVRSLGSGRPAAPPLLIVRFPSSRFALASEYAADSTDTASFAVDVLEVVCEAGGLLSGEELEWYRANNGRYHYALLRGDAVEGEQTIRHSWTVRSDAVHVPTRQPIVVAKIPASTVVAIAGGHRRLADVRFPKRTRIEANAEGSETAYTRSTRPANDLVEILDGTPDSEQQQQQRSDCAIS